MNQELTSKEEQDDDQEQEGQPVPELEEFDEEELDDIFDRLEGDL